MNWAKFGMFAGGVLFGTAGIAILKSNDAKKLYTHCTAAVLRGKDSVCNTYTNIKENCGDIYSDATDINDARYAKADAEKLAKAKALVEEYEKKNNAPADAE